MNAFKHSHYVDLVRDFLHRNRGQVGIKTKLAKAAACRLSYLSHVLSGKAHFTMDHAFGAAGYMRLAPAEQEFFLLLVQDARAASRSYHDHLRVQIARLKADNFRVEKVVESSSGLTEPEYERYAGDWLLQAVHIYLTIPQYQRFDALREKLNLSPAHLRDILDCLFRLRLAKPQKNAAHWVPILKDMHAPLSSSAATQRHWQWKMRAITDLQRKNQDSIHYGATFSLSKADFDKIKADLLALIRSSRDLAVQSPEEIVAHLDISFFEI